MAPKRLTLIGGCIALVLAALQACTAPGTVAPEGGVQRLYILNCGEGRAGDTSLWSPGVPDSLHRLQCRPRTDASTGCFANGT